MKTKTKWISLVSGLTAAFMCIEHGYASAPTAGTNPTNTTLETSDISDARAQKTGTPDLDQDLTKLNSLESGYAEGNSQQTRLKHSTTAVVRKLNAKKRVVSEE